MLLNHCLGTKPANKPPKQTNKPLGSPVLLLHYSTVRWKKQNIKRKITNSNWLNNSQPYPNKGLLAHTRHFGYNDKHGEKPRHPHVQKLFGKLLYVKTTGKSSKINILTKHANIFQQKILVGCIWFCIFNRITWIKKFMVTN